MSLDTFLTVGLLMLMSMGVGAGISEIAANRRRNRDVPPETPNDPTVRPYSADPSRRHIDPKDTP